MATSVRNLDTLKADRAITVQNQHRLVMMKVKAGLIFHADASVADASPTAADLPTVIVMANNLKSEINTHMASACSATTGQGCHLAADATNPVATAAATDQTTANALLNGIKTGYNAHLTQAGVHMTNDGTNSVATANATDLTTSIALANALKTAINAHFAAAMASTATLLVSP